mgnify:CR=1 FL=1
MDPTAYAGGYVDFNYFRIANQMTGAAKPSSILKAGLTDSLNVKGTPGEKFAIAQAGSLTARGIRFYLSILDNTGTAYS